MDFFIQLLPAFVEGLKITLFFWVVTLVGSFVLALPMVYVRLSRNAVVSTIVRFYIYIMRGTPLLLQLMFVYFGLPYLGIRLDRTTAAILAFLLNYTAYFTEILRGGIQSIDEGQKEAAKLLGYSNSYTITLFFWVVTLVGSFVLALPMVYVRLSRNAVVSTIVRFYIYIMRGTPLLLQLMFVYFGLPYLGIRLDRTTAAILAFLLNYTAYFTEILRGGIQSIDEGQKEAAKLLGYSNSYTFLHILLPQALRNCIPSFINESLTLLKDTCLVSILGIDELLRYAKIAAGTYATGLPFIYVGVIYLVLNMPISRGLNYLEKRLNYYK